MSFFNKSYLIYHYPTQSSVSSHVRVAYSHCLVPLPMTNGLTRTSQWASEYKYVGMEGCGLWEDRWTRLNEGGFLGSLTDQQSQGNSIFIWFVESITAFSWTLDQVGKKWGATPWNKVKNSFELCCLSVCA